MDQLIDFIKLLIKKIDSLLDNKSNDSAYKISVSPQDIVTDNKTVRVRCNKIIVKNMSNYIVRLFRTYTLVPGEVFEMGSEKNDHKTICDMEIEFGTTLFDSAEPDIKRVEILEINRIGGAASFTETPSKTEAKPFY